MEITYTVTTLSEEEIVENHISVLSSFVLSTKDDDCDLLSIYWIPKFHKNPFKQRYIARYEKCTTKFLSKRLTSLLTAVKQGLQSYHNTCYSHSGINLIWILKNSKYLLETLNSRLLSEYISIKTCVFLNTVYWYSSYSVKIPTLKHISSLFLQKRWYT